MVLASFAAVLEAPLVTLGGVLWLKLPPGDRFKAFRPTDFVTFALFAPGIALPF